MKYLVSMLHIQSQISMYLLIILVYMHIIWMALHMVWTSISIKHIRHFYIYNILYYRLLQNYHKSDEVFLKFILIQISKKFISASDSEVKKTLIWIANTEIYTSKTISILNHLIIFMIHSNLSFRLKILRFIL